MSHLHENSEPSGEREAIAAELCQDISPCHLSIIKKSGVHLIVVRPASGVSLQKLQGEFAAASSRMRELNPELPLFLFMEADFDIQALGEAELGLLGLQRIPVEDANYS